MGKINREWHLAHPMPKNASEDERITWHTEHARNCGCRAIEGGVAELFRKRGLPIPKFEPAGVPKAG